MDKRLEEIEKRQALNNVISQLLEELKNQVLITERYKDYWLIAESELEQLKKENERLKKPLVEIPDTTEKKKPLPQITT